MSHNKFYIFSLFLLLLASVSVRAQLDVFQAKSQTVLNKYVRDGLVDYENLSQNPELVKALKNATAAAKTTDLTPQELKAFLINAYNMTVVVSIAENYPTASVIDIDDFFNKNKHQIAGKWLTLNELEKGWLFKKFPDERLHFTLVCGAISCPPLKGTLFLSQSIESRLEKTTKTTLNNPQFITIDMHEKTVTVSKLFEWYSSDFKKKGSLINYINIYSDKTVPDGFKVRFMEYDWRLNKQ